MIENEILKYNKKCTIALRKYRDSFLTIKTSKNHDYILRDITLYLDIDGEMENRVKMTLLVLSFPMIEPFFFTTITITE